MSNSQGVNWTGPVPGKPDTEAWIFRHPVKAGR